MRQTTSIGTLGQTTSIGTLDHECGIPVQSTSYGAIFLRYRVTIPHDSVRNVSGWVLGRLGMIRFSIMASSDIVV